MLNLSDANFHAERTKSGFLLVDFWAVWCPPCKAMNPIIEQVAKDYPSVNFAKLNTTENPEVTSEYKIQSIPAFILFKDGEIVQRTSGLRPAADMGKWLEEGGATK